VLVKEPREIGVGRLTNVAVWVWGFFGSVNAHRISKNKAVGRVRTAAQADLKVVLTCSDSAFGLFREDQNMLKMLTQCKATMLEQRRQSL